MKRATLEKMAVNKFYCYKILDEINYESNCVYYCHTYLYVNRLQKADMALLLP